MCAFVADGRWECECSMGVVGTSQRVSQTSILKCGGLCGGLVGSSSLSYGAVYAAV